MFVGRCIFEATMTKTVPISFTIFLLMALITWSCKPTVDNTKPDPLSHIQDAQAASVLTKAMDRAGGLEHWQKKRSLQFRKSTVLYLENGEVESMADQLHKYTYADPSTVEIEWMEGQDKIKLTSDYSSVSRTRNNQPDNSLDPVSGMNSVLSSTYVISIPFKLLDPGVELEYLGIDTLEDHSIVHVLQAEHQPTDNPEEYDTWWHYYDHETYRQIGYMVRHADHFSLVKNLSFVMVDGFEMVKDRRSYRADEDGKVDYLRAVYEYTNYHFTF